MRELLETLPKYRADLLLNMQFTLYLILLLVYCVMLFIGWCCRAHGFLIQNRLCSGWVDFVCLFLRP